MKTVKRNRCNDMLTRLTHLRPSMVSQRNSFFSYSFSIPFTNSPRFLDTDCLQTWLNLSECEFNALQWSWSQLLYLCIDVTTSAQIGGNQTARKLIDRLCPYGSTHVYTTRHTSFPNSTLTRKRTVHSFLFLSSFSHMYEILIPSWLLRKVNEI